MVKLPWHDVSPHQNVRLEEVPLNVVIFGLAFTTMALGALRFHSRLFAWQRGSRRIGFRVAVIGSRDAGAAVVREMLRNPGAGLVPVAVFDDDAGAHGLSLLGVPVVGGVDDIPASASRYAIQQVLLAIPSSAPKSWNGPCRPQNSRGAPCGSSPGPRDPGKQHRHRSARPAGPGSRIFWAATPVGTDWGRARCPPEHRVLITGAGGSIGSEIARQVASFGPARSSLSTTTRPTSTTPAMAVPGPPCRSYSTSSDRGAVFEAIHRYRPDVIFHAAAHKHVPVLEAHPLAAGSTCSAP